MVIQELFVFRFGSSGLKCLIIKHCLVVLVGRNYNGGRKTPVNRQVAMKELLNVVQSLNMNCNLKI